MGSSMSTESSSQQDAQQQPVEQQQVQQEQLQQSVQQQLLQQQPVQQLQSLPRMPNSGWTQTRSRRGPPAQVLLPQYRSSLSFQDFSSFADDDALSQGAAPLQPVGTQEPDPDVSHEGPLSLSTRVEYSALPKGASQAVFGLITVQAKSLEAGVTSSSDGERRPMDIVCVLDVSGSMGSNNKIGDLKEAVRFIISEARPQDRLSIVTFNSSADRKLKLRRMDRHGQDEATVETMRLTAGGGTCIAAGLDMGLAVLEKRRQRNSVSAILLLTDGQDHSTRPHLQKLMQRAANAGCGLYAFGFGKDHDADLLREISEQARTPYTFVENTSCIKEAFAGVVGGLSSIVAQRVELSLSCQAVLKEVSTPFEVQRDGDKKAKVTIPDVFAGERRDVLVELSVPAGDSTETLLEASARYVDLRGQQGVLVQTASVTMSVLRVEEPQPELEPDAEVTDQRERVEVTRVLEQAAVHSDEGRFEEAQQLLQAQRSKVSKRLTPISEALGLELQDAEQRMASRSTWQLGAAEVKDAFQMHKMQRCTNSTMSASATVSKRSKAMYLTSMQSEWVRKSSAASSSGY
eukprot:TRINITY_DN1278_c0_g1_i1.p1 TRINITY_DN1278_c0_g1~~TRINITY_DN1278_c0_g1_i1.p1  ORF type:complete len:574 (-),score=172.02 TRINITY_DN1278_c0_g1_i1:334-2055(-)